jgi:hypothetical protein
VLGERHLLRVLHAYPSYYHTSRTHRSLEDDHPDPRPVEPPEIGDVVVYPQVGGLHRGDRWAHASPRWSHGYLPLPNFDHSAGGLKPRAPCLGWALLRGEVVDGQEDEVVQTLPPEAPHKPLNVGRIGCTVWDRNPFDAQHFSQPQSQGTAIGSSRSARPAPAELAQDPIVVTDKETGTEPNGVASLIRCFVGDAVTARWTTRRLRSSMITRTYLTE